MADYKQLGDGLFTGPRPSGQDLKYAKQQGIQTIIDFRIAEETTTPNADL